MLRPTLRFFQSNRLLIGLNRFGKVLQRFVAKSQIFARFPKAGLNPQARQELVARLRVTTCFVQDSAVNISYLRLVWF